jgi:hypothetical protein
MNESIPRPVRLAYQPPASSTFPSQQISHQQPVNSTFLSEQTSTSRQPPAKRTGCRFLKKSNTDPLANSDGRQGIGEFAMLEICSN